MSVLRVHSLALATTHRSAREHAHNTCLHVPRAQLLAVQGLGLAERQTSFLCLRRERAGSFSILCLISLSWRPAAGLWEQESEGNIPGPPQGAPAPLSVSMTSWDWAGQKLPPHPQFLSFVP